MVVLNIGVFLLVCLICFVAGAISWPFIKKRIVENRKEAKERKVAEKAAKATAKTNET